MIAELMPSEQEKAQGGVAAGGSSALREEVRRAAAASQRAVEGQAIPSRHADLIRRVFRRFTERTEKAPEPSAKPAGESAPR